MDKPKILVVVHAQDCAQILRNVAVARENLADGALLINHIPSVGPSMTGEDLVRHFGAARTEHPDFWLGLNVYARDNSDALVLAANAGADCLWIDDGGINEASAKPDEQARRLWEFRYIRAPGLGIWGGVAFKGQEQVHDPARAAWLALPWMDVVVTSGERTGIAPSVEKVKQMRDAIAGFPLGIASGITPENARDYMPYVTHILAATGISHSETEISPYRLRRLVRAVS